jgi:predicted dehydrogenase
MHRIGILGAAGIAPQAIIEPARRRDDTEIYAVSSKRPGAAQAYAEKHLIPNAFDSYDSMLADPEIDIVYNALPPSDHAEWSIKALEAGKHVLCEKPFALNVTQAKAMVEASQRTGLRLVEAFHDRYHPVFIHLLERVLSGQLGTIKRITAEFSVEIPFGPDSLRHSPALGGGALMDLGCYPVHWVRSLTGEEFEVVAASGTSNPLGVDERITATLRFPSGIFVDFSTAMSKGLPFKALLAIDAQNGTIEVENPVLAHKGHSIRERINGGFDVFTLAGGSTYDYQLEAMIKAVETGQPALTEGHDPIGNMAAIGAIYEKAGFHLYKDK